MKVISPKNGWRPTTHYLVKVSFSENHAPHESIFYSGFLQDGEPAGYNCLLNHKYDGKYTIKNTYYLEVVGELNIGEIMRAHREAIIAWVEGADLQYRNLDGIWLDFQPTDFSSYLNIRVKPEVEETAEQKRKMKIEALQEQIAQLEALS